MKKGVAGVRLCDQSGCYDRWPCERHGTATAFPMDGRLLGGITAVRLQAGIELVNERFPERPPCSDCGYQMSCWCEARHEAIRPSPPPIEPVAEPLTGWDLVHDGTSYHYRNYSMPPDYRVYRTASGVWTALELPRYYDSPTHAMMEAEQDFARRYPEPAEQPPNLPDRWCASLQKDVYFLRGRPDIAVIRRDPLHPAAEQFPWTMVTHDTAGHYITMQGAMIAAERFADAVCGDD